MAEDSINMDNIFDMMKELSTAYPQQYAELNITSDTCNLNKELDNVCSASLPSFYRERVNTVVFKVKGLSECFLVLFWKHQFSF